MSATMVVFVPLSARSTSEQGASTPVAFHISVARPPGIAVMSWCDAVMSDTTVAPLPSMLTMLIRPAPAFWTFSAIAYILLPSQLIWARLAWSGAVAHHTGSPSAS